MNELMGLYRAKANSSFKKIIDLLPLIVVVGSFGLYLANEDKSIAVTQAQIQALLDQNRIQDNKLQNIQTEVDEIYKIMIEKKDDDSRERF